MADVKQTSSRPLAVVTGSSSGIGLELARIFAENGYDLVIVAENDHIFEVRDQIAAKSSAEVKAYEIDLSNFTNVEEFYHLLRNLDRPIDALALNAGIGVAGSFAKQTSLEDELTMINLNVVSTVHLAKRVISMMVREGHGRVLFTSAVASLAPEPYEAVYAATKAFVQSFAMALRKELLSTGVSVTALLPSATNTNFYHRAGLEHTRIARAKKNDPALVAQKGYDGLMNGEEQVMVGSLSDEEHLHDEDFSASKTERSH